ncbi:hypothetical protein FA15DRAFT_673479 [Coprinopsis marcescibilis]|uniref:Extracellular membrane protein CFEM domain-containing protein n=1 Tax=Coprinopsis marcescibilis TaxID=230819 RepID=A0A5C3KJX1_COPMA|nr:hypothetical protein FA15DRAFT_673479 [Coprinopsis marcescibilis]
MYSIFFIYAVFAALAGRALAFNIPFGGVNISTSDLLTIQESPVTLACTADCGLAQTKILACNDATPCLCTNDTVSSFARCQTCMLDFLIQQNIPAPDTRAGSNVLVGGYAAGCAAANITVPKEFAALTLPAFWEGPFVAVLPEAGGIAVAVLGALLGGSAIVLLSNM